MPTHLYTRSSFTKWLQEVHTCEIKLLRDKMVLKVINGPVSCFIWLNNDDTIEFTEIYAVCKKLFLDIPGDRDLKRID